MDHHEFTIFKVWPLGVPYLAPKYYGCILSCLKSWNTKRIFFVLKTANNVQLLFYTNKNLNTIIKSLFTQKKSRKIQIRFVQGVLFNEGLKCQIVLKLFSSNHSSTLIWKARLFPRVTYEIYVWDESKNLKYILLCHNLSQIDLTKPLWFILSARLEYCNDLKYLASPCWKGLWLIW